MSLDFFAYRTHSPSREVEPSLVCYPLKEINHSGIALNSQSSGRCLFCVPHNLLLITSYNRCATALKPRKWPPFSRRSSYIIWVVVWNSALQSSHLNVPNGMSDFVKIKCAYMRKREITCQKHMNMYEAILDCWNVRLHLWYLYITPMTPYLYPTSWYLAV